MLRFFITLYVLLLYRIVIMLLSNITMLTMLCSIAPVCAACVCVLVTVEAEAEHVDNRYDSDISGVNSHATSGDLSDLSPSVSSSCGGEDVTMETNNNTLEMRDSDPGYHRQQDSDDSVILPMLLSCCAVMILSIVCVCITFGVTHYIGESLSFVYCSSYRRRRHCPLVDVAISARTLHARQFCAQR